MADTITRVFLPAGARATGGPVPASPFQLYFDGNMNLRLEGWNSLTNSTLQLQGLFMREDGTMNWFTKTLPLTANRARAAVDIPMERGFVANLVCVAIGATPRIGQTFARISITLGLTGSTIVLGVLLQGYVTAAQGLGWPGSPIRSSVDGQGAMRYTEPADPAAGGEFEVLQPAGARWRVVSLFANLVTAAGGGTRVPILQLGDLGGAIIARIPTTGSQGPSTSAIYTWGIGLGQPVVAGTGVFTGALPDGVTLSNQAIIRSVTNGLGATDQWFLDSYLVEEWLEVN